MTRKPHQPSRSNKSENEEVLVDSTPSLLLLPKKTLTEKPKSVGVLSNDKESFTSVDPQDQIVEEEVLSVSRPQDVEKRQAQAQGRRLDAADLQTFKDRCESTSGLTGSNAYVDCVGGKVNGNPSRSCVDACDGKCCSDGGPFACDGFNGKGEQRVILHIVLF